MCGGGGGAFLVFMVVGVFMSVVLSAVVVVWFSAVQVVVVFIWFSVGVTVLA